MKIAQPFLLAVVLASAPAVADDYTSVPLNYLRTLSADVTAVKLLDSKVVVETIAEGRTQNQYAVVTLGVDSLPDNCRVVTGVDEFGGQASLESDMNPTDEYYRVHVRLKSPDCMSVSAGPAVHSKIDLKFFVQQRFAPFDQPWPAPSWTANESVHQLSFDSGMMGGLNRWLLYRLDYTDPANVKFEFKKQYSYVQGQAVDAP